ncbi:uncharacterized protein [Parasteatoda tepidariorum]|uniref:uncharacterized protein n=1 Tax=Parasteatoda tepidariorum TaxID=114398 RepID=UPI00077F9657|nr:uncharacterized protein LOC107436185 [Parasteatoda tepidariorum]
MLEKPFCHVLTKSLKSIIGQQQQSLLRSSVLRYVGSNNGSSEKDLSKRKVEVNFPEKTVTIYTCENIYNEWKKDGTFYKIPESGVFAKIDYIDTGVNKTAFEKPPKTVLCIHGIPGNYSVFNHLINDLSNEGVRVIVPSFPASLYLPGKHKKELFRHTVEEKTQVFKDFLKAIDVKNLDAIISHSSAVYPALHLVLDPDLKVKCQVLFNTGGHKKTVAMRPYWIVYSCSYLYLTNLGRKIVQLTGKFIMKWILKTPIKDDNLDGVMLLAITMVFSKYKKARTLMAEIAEKEIPTLFCFSEDDKVVERNLSYEVVGIFGAFKDNINYYDENANLITKGEDFSWLKLLSFKEGSHYVFRKHSEVCNKEVIELLKSV